jgi:hypothetical protein
MIAPPLVASAATGLLEGTGLLVVLFFVVLYTATAAMLLSALPELWRHWSVADQPDLAPVLASEALPTVSVVVIGRADQEWTIENVRALLALSYPRHEVVLVHDGAEHGCLEALIDTFDLYLVPPAVLVNVPTAPVRGYYRSQRYGKLFVIDKGFEGAADDLNAALNASRFPYVLTMHVRSRLAPDALHRLMRPFLIGERPAAVAGTVRIGATGLVPNDGGRASVASRWLAGIRTVERLRESVFSRLGWNRFGGKLPSQGGVLLHRRDHLLEIDGFRGAAADPERDAVERLRSELRAQHRDDTLPAIPDAVAWERATATAGAVGRRRATVHGGRLDELLARRRARAGTRGRTRLLVPLHLLSAAAAPVAELVGYVLLLIALGAHGWRDRFVALFLLAMPAYAILLSLWAIVLERACSPERMPAREMVRLSLHAIAEQLGYRQWIMWHRLRATWQAARRARWSEPEHRPLLSPDGELPAADRVRVR